MISLHSCFQAGAATEPGRASKDKTRINFIYDKLFIIFLVSPGSGGDRAGFSSCGIDSGGAVGAVCQPVVPHSVLKSLK